MRRGLSSGLVVVLALILMTAGGIAGGTFGGSWGSRLRVMNTDLVERVSGQDDASAQVLSPFGETLSRDALARKTKVSGCPAPCTGSVLYFTGYASGIGSLDGTVNVQGAGYALISCFNPAGSPGSSSPGANRELLIASGVDGFGDDEVTKNGKLTIPSLETDTSGIIGQVLEPATDYGCPGDKWTAQITGIQWVEGIIYIYQNGELTACEVTVFEGSGGVLSCSAL